MVRPGEHPKVMELEHTNEAMQKAVNGRIYQAVYPWKEMAALVCDEEALWNEEQKLNRYVKALDYPVKGPFFLCGLTEDSFTDLPDDLIRRFMREFWCPEQFFDMGIQMLIIREDDGTTPEGGGADEQTDH